MSNLFFNLQTIISLLNRNEFLLDNSKNFAVWFFKKGLAYQTINEFEKEIAEKLSFNKSQEYSYSRGYARLALSNLFQIKPLDVPIYSFPGTQPILKKGWGYLSMSHCKDSLIIAWSIKRIGVDIERSDRNFSYKKICERFFTTKEKMNFKNLQDCNQRRFVLNHWIMKESSFKWQRNKSPNDLFGWEWDIGRNTCSHEKLKQKLKFSLIHYDEWSIGLSTCFLKNNSTPIICVQ